MANILKGHRGNLTGSFKEVKKITDTYSAKPPQFSRN